MQHSLQTKQDFSQHTTQILRVTLPALRKPASLRKKLLVVVWLAGATLVILTYLIFPLLILFHQLFNRALEVVLAGNIFLVIEVVISCILLKIARPARVSSSSITPAPYSVQKNQPAALPTTPVPASFAAWRLAQMRSAQFNHVISTPESQQV